MWQNWKACARAYVVPRIGAEHLQRLDEPQLLKLYGTSLAEGHINQDRDGGMYAYWTERVTKGENPTAARFPNPVDRRSMPHVQRCAATGRASSPSRSHPVWRPRPSATSVR